MSKNTNTTNAVNSYVLHFQEAQTNLTILIREERLKKRIEKSRQKSLRSYD